MLLLIFLLLINSVFSQKCKSNIINLQPPECTVNNIGPLGIKETLRFGKLLFDKHDVVINNNQLNCILNSPFKISNDIKLCIRDLTINNETLPEKVARGLALNNENNWVSACQPNMPCIEFNKFVYKDSRVNISLLSVGDGLTLARKL